jgi:hypothetical protein
LELGRTLVDVLREQRGSIHVNLALRLNVLAVCAVFAFVGAVLLGAF